jgi:hypothetical protein
MTILKVVVLVVVTANVLGTIVEMATDMEARRCVRTNLKMVRRTKLEAKVRIS